MNENIGTICYWTADNVPANWLELDGSVLSKEEYPELYALIGDYMDASLAEDQFRLPDFRGYFVRGADMAAGVDPNYSTRTNLYTGGISGGNVGTYQNDILKDHTHKVREDGNHSHSGGDFDYTNVSIVAAPYAPFIDGGIPYETGSNDFRHKHSGQDTGGNETRPANIYLTAIIKAK